MDISSDSQVAFIIDEIFVNDQHQDMSDANSYTTYGPPNDEHIPSTSSAADGQRELHPDAWGPFNDVRYHRGTIDIRRPHNVYEQCCSYDLSQ